MRTLRLLGNVLWYFPFFGFVDAIFAFLWGLFFTATVVGAPIGLGLMEYGKFLLAPFGRAMVSKSDLNIEQNKAWKAYSTLVMVLYFPVGLILVMLAVVQIALLFVTIIGIPAALVIAKSLGTLINPVNKKCVPSAVADHLEKQAAQADVAGYFAAERSAPEAAAQGPLAKV